MRKIRITAGSVTCLGELNESNCAEAVWKALPLKSQVNTWGDEIYFSIPVHHELEKDAQEVVDEGDLGYWPQGPAFCIFFGPTPMSRGDEIRPASAVNVIGNISHDPTVFRAVKPGEFIIIEKAHDE
jgi:hypothetical protein